MSDAGDFAANETVRQRLMRRLAKSEHSFEDLRLGLEISARELEESPPDGADHANTCYPRRLTHHAVDVCRPRGKSRAPDWRPNAWKKRTGPEA